jgi:hypothetical protein
MSDPREPRPSKPIPLLIWAALGFVLVLGFMVILRVLNPPDIGRAPPTPDIVVPAAPKRGSVV